jgi:hypothetical protein
LYADQPVILGDDLDKIVGEKAEGASSDIDAKFIEWDTSLHDTFTTSELASAPTESIDTPGPWCDKGRSIEEPAPGLRPQEQHSSPPAPAQAQPQTGPQSSAPYQYQTSQQGVGSIARSAPKESTLHSLPKPFDSGGEGWTDEDTAELEKELGLALEEQLQNEIQSRERSGTAGGRLDELRVASRPGTPAQDLEWEQQETRVWLEGGAVTVQQREELAAQEAKLGQPAGGDQQDLVKVVDLDDPEDREATEDLPSTQPEIEGNDEHRFRLRGVRARQFPGLQIKTTQYRVVWGEYPNRSYSWFNEDDVQISMPCVPNAQDLALPIRVRKMRSSQRKGRKVFEYLVNIFGLDDRTWITGDQLRISLSPMLVAEPKGN